MSFRSRPVLDRKHRPRWQDELRTQQLTLVAFALAIALALGIFGAAAWNGYWESHLRPIASVAGVSIDRSDVTVREQILTAEGIAAITELQAQVAGGPRDQAIQQQIDNLSQQLNGVTTSATASLVDNAVLASRADELGVTISEDDVDSAIAERLSLPERVWANLILVDPLPEDAEPDAEPTDEQIEAATEEAQAALDRVEEGEDFGIVATDVSDDLSSAYAGSIGWFGEDDPIYAEYFDALADAEDGDLVGPVETEDGIAVLQLVQRREATEDSGLRDLLRGQGVDDDDYRAYVRGHVVADGFQEQFETEVAISPAEQRRVAQIVIAPVSGTVVPQERARHVLVQPDPELQDQIEATDEQWAAALAEASDLADQLAAPDADWSTIAEEHSDDPGSASRGGDLGWYDPSDSPFVEPFNAALATLEIGDVSGPVLTDFGYHIIQKTAERESPQAQVADIVERLEEDPDAFAEIAEAESEDSATASEGGELGWVARWELTRALEDAIFGLAEVGDVSDPVDEGAAGITIYRLLEASESREVEEDRLDAIHGSGFSRWLDEVVRAPVDTWIDPQFAPSTANT
ncbi:MAG TPA: peptidylprolyl isomerase [Candidatus Limnocylindria bacterium]|jgi:parvulin-like peptidyl-prolyl isomerase